ALDRADRVVDGHVAERGARRIDVHFGMLVLLGETIEHAIVFAAHRDRGRRLVLGVVDGERAPRAAERAREVRDDDAGSARLLETQAEVAGWIAGGDGIASVANALRPVVRETD